MNQSLSTRTDSFLHFNFGTGSRSVKGHLEIGRLRQLCVRVEVANLICIEVVPIEDGGKNSNLLREVRRRSKAEAAIEQSVPDHADSSPAVDDVIAERVQLVVELAAVDEKRCLRVVVVVTAHRSFRQRKIDDVAKLSFRS